MQQAIEVQRISTGAFPDANRFSYWSDVVMRTFVPLQCDTPNRRRFRGELRHRQIGLIGVSEVRASAMTARRTQATIASAPSDDAVVVLQMSGSCNAGQRTQNVWLKPGDGAIVLADEPYFFDFDKPFDQYVLKLPRALIAKGQVAGARQRTLLLSSAATKLLCQLAVCSLGEGLSFSHDEAIGVEQAIADLVSAAMPSPVLEANDGGAASQYAIASQFIRRQLSNPALTPALVAAQLKISTRHLARLFAVQGTTVDRTIWSERLWAARRDLADPRLQDCSITQIAFSWAFSDAAHFSRRFSSAFGLSPMAFRAVSLARRAPPQIDAEALE